MNAAEDDVFDIVRRQEIVGFLGFVSDGVFGVDRDAVDLLGPGVSDFAFLWVATASHVRVVNGQNTFEGGIGPTPSGAPAFGFGEFDGGFGKGGVFGCAALGMFVVVRGHGTGGVNDECAFVSCRVQQAIKGGGHFGNSSGCRFAPMVVPHVANDDGGLLGVPGGLAFFDGRWGFLAAVAEG